MIMDMPLSCHYFFVNCAFSVRAGGFAVALKFKVASPEDRQPKFVVLPACLALAGEGGWPKRPEVALLSHGTESPRPHSLARSATFASSYVSRVVILIALFARGGIGGGGSCHCIMSLLAPSSALRR